jgi:hypothetical protein
MVATEQLKVTWSLHRDDSLRLPPDKRDGMILLSAWLAKIILLIVTTDPLAQQKQRQQGCAAILLRSLPGPLLSGMRSGHRD